MVRSGPGIEPFCLCGDPISGVGSFLCAVHVSTVLSPSLGGVWREKEEGRKKKESERQAGRRESMRSAHATFNKHLVKIILKMQQNV